MVTKTDEEAMADFGRRLKERRLELNLPLRVVAKRAMLSATTVVNAEAGANPSLETIVQILRVLGQLNALDAFLPPSVNAAARLTRSGTKRRQRARMPRYVREPALSELGEEEAESTLLPLTHHKLPPRAD